MAEHVNECIIAVKQLACGGGHKHTLLHLSEEGFVFLLRRQVIGGVANNVDGSGLSPTLFCIRGTRHQARSAEHGINSFEEAVLGIATAVWALLPLTLMLTRKNRAAEPSHNISGSHAQALQQSPVGLHDPEFGIMNQDHVVNRVEGVRPLPL